MLQSNTTFYLRGTISQTLTVWGTFNISNDTELWLPIDTNGEIVSIVFRSDRQIERMTVTITNSICTVVTRGIEQSGWNPNVGLQKQWNEGVLGYITALDFDIIDKDGDSNTISADNDFTWDNNFKKITFNSTVDAGLEVNSLTTAERTALIPVNGSIVYDETLGQLYMYIWGSWASIDTGTATPNMSETVNGTAEIATAGERATAQSVWSTGARLVVSNDALKKTSAGASDENKIPVLNASGKVDNFVTQVPDASTTTKGIVERATSSEVEAWTDTTRYVTPSTLNRNWLVKILYVWTQETGVLNNELFSYTHNLWFTQSDVESNRYDIFLAARVNGKTELLWRQGGSSAGLWGWNSGRAIVDHIWSASDPSVWQTNQVNHQANTLKIRVWSDGADIDYFRLIIHKIY